jgi:hypothetical protein
MEDMYPTLKINTPRHSVRVELSGVSGFPRDEYIRRYVILDRKTGEDIADAHTVSEAHNQLDYNLSEQQEEKQNDITGLIACIF